MQTICIIVPAYNAEDTLDCCLKSLSEQTFQDWTAVVVDDSSTDATASILKAWAEDDPRIKASRGRHAGAAAARNTALDIAKRLEPRYITFLDADDYLEKDTLELMAGAAQKTGADIVHCKFFSDYSSGYEYEAINLFPADSLIPNSRFPSTVYRKMILGIQMNHVCSKLYRADLFDGMRFDESMRTAEDLLMNMEIFPKAASYFYLARPLYHYMRDTRGGLTNNSLSYAEKFKCNWRVSMRMLELLPSWGMNRLTVRICVISRPLLLLFSKCYRALRKKAFETLMRMGKTAKSASGEGA